MTDHLYLARHGESKLNAAGLLRGRLDSPLTSKGRAQAASLARALAGCDLQIIVASPLHRAFDTAQAVATGTNVPVEVDIRFIDRDYGVWAGQSLTKVEELWGSIDDAPGVEPRGAVLQRASVALLEVFERLDGKSGLIVSHDAILGPLLVWLAPELDGEPLVQDTGSYNLLERTTNGWRVANTNIVPEA